MFACFHEAEIFGMTFHFILAAYATYRVEVKKSE